MATALVTGPDGSIITVTDTIEGDLMTSITEEGDTDTASEATPALPGPTETDRARAGVTVTSGPGGAGPHVMNISYILMFFAETKTDSNTATDETGTQTQNISDFETTTGGPGTNMTSCANNVCRNGGTCLTSIDGFQCHCRLGYMCPPL